MRTYGCSGTLGDTYVNLCILYYMAKRKPIVCRHYTIHTDWHVLIKQIYSLLPNIRVEFINQRDTDNPRIYSSFVPHEKFGEVLSSPDDWCIFPDFVFPETEVELPDKYVVLNPQSGKPNENRSMKAETIDKILKISKEPIVIIGTDSRHKNIVAENVINLIGQISLLEAMRITSRADCFMGFQGLMSFVAMSYRVLSDIYARQQSDISAIEARLPQEWEQYCSIMRD